MECKKYIEGNTSGIRRYTRAFLNSAGLEMMTMLRGRSFQNDAVKKKKGVQKGDSLGHRKCD